jgi:2-polyprenyl-3-methyl-5-hydroxy-6-metoxy-1,4-benzoquinol methylase
MREKILPFFKEHNVEKVLDFGCGRYLRDSLLLAKHHIFVDAVDLEEQIRRIEPKKSRRVHSLSAEIIDKEYDATLLNFVIQVLPTQEQRTEILEKVYNAIKAEGYLVLSVRNPKDIRHSVKPRGIPFNDGFMVKKNNAYTFVKTYEKKEVESVLNSLDLTTIRIFSTSDSYIALARK